MVVQDETRPLVSILIPTKDRKDHLIRGIDALKAQRYRPIEIIVIDNGSTDGTVEAVRTKHPDVAVLGDGTNNGFAASVNMAARKASGVFQISFADDILVQDGYIEALTSALSDPTIGAVGGIVREWPDTSQLNYGGARVSRILRLRIERERAPNRTSEVQFISGNNFCMRRDLFLDIGGFDQSYTSWFEDLDLCMLLMRRGYRLLVVPSAEIHHLSHGTASSPYREFYTRRNVWLFYFRHAPLPVLLGFMGYQTFVALPKDVLRALWRRDGALLKAAIAGQTWWLGNAGRLRGHRRAARASIETRRGPT